MVFIPWRPHDTMSMANVLTAFILCFAFSNGKVVLDGPSERAEVVGSEAIFICDVIDDVTNYNVVDEPFVVTWTFQPFDNLDAVSDVMTIVHIGGQKFKSLTPDGAKYGNVTSHLRLHTVALSDAGRYTCQSNLTGSMAMAAQLMVIDHPRCQNLKPRVYYRENISLECDVRYAGYKHPNVVWRFGSLAMNSTREIQENSTSLKERLILEATEKVKGHVYHCEVFYPDLLSVQCLATPPIQVYSKTQITSLHVYPVVRGNHYPLGSNIILHCVAKGYPSPTFSWNFTPAGSSETVERKWVTTQLSITDFTEAQAGTYECITTNEIMLKGGPRGEDRVEISTDARAVNISVAPDVEPLAQARNTAYIISSNANTAQQNSPQMAAHDNRMHFSPYAVGAVVSAGLAILLIIVFVSMAVRMKKREKRMREKLARGHDETLDDQEVELLDEGTQPASEYLPTEYSRVKMSWEIPRKDVRLLEQVGKGAFVEVWKGRMRRSPGSNEVMRVIIKKLQGEASEKEHHFFRAELEVLKMLPAHANVIRLVGSYTANEPWLVMMEAASEGSLEQFLQRHRPGHQQVVSISNNRVDNQAGVVSMKKHTLTPHKLLALAAQVASGLDHLDKFKLVYYRLRSCKILVAKGGICKLSGFGFAKEMTERNIYEQNSLPVRWTAPESLRTKECNVKTDTWAYGIVAWEILHFGTTPYPTMGPVEVVESVQTGFRMPKPQHCSTELYELLLRCWHTIPEERPSYQEILEVLSSLVVNAQIHIDFSTLPDHLLSLGEIGDNSASF